MRYNLKSLGAGGRFQEVKCLLYKPVSLSLTPRTYVEV